MGDRLRQFSKQNLHIRHIVSLERNWDFVPASLAIKIVEIPASFLIQRINWDDVMDVQVLHSVSDVL